MKKFVTAVNCMDGRVQEPVVGYMKKRYGADYVDMITEAGPDRILSEKKDDCLINGIRDRILVSVEKHNSGTVAIFSHDDCTGNPVGKNEHIEMTMDSVSLVRSWVKDVNVRGFWIDENREIHEIT